MPSARRVEPLSAASVLRQQRVEAADQARAASTRQVACRQAGGAGGREVDQAHTVGPQPAAQLAQPGQVHLHFPVERDRHADGRQRQVLRRIDPEIRERVDAGADVVRRVAQQRLQRGRDAVDLVEIVVGEDGHAHQATSVAAGATPEITS